MKKTLFLTVFILMLTALSSVKAQSCDSIVLPHFAYNVSQYENAPAEKIAWYCAFSHACFELVSELPADATVLPISSISNRWTGEPLPDNFVVDLPNLSVYKYTFQDVQLPRAGQVLFFSVGNTDTPYLMLRSHSDACHIADDIVQDYINEIR